MRGVVWNTKQITPYNYITPTSIEHVWAEALDKSLVGRDSTCLENYQALFITPTKEMTTKDLKKIKKLVDKKHPVYLIGKHDVEEQWYQELPKIDPSTLLKQPYYQQFLDSLNELDL